MHFVLAVVFCITNAEFIKGVSEVYNITDILTSLLNNTNEKIDDLKDKLETINKYVIDNDKFAELLLNITRESDLNETNFFSALSENDQFRFLLEDEPKSLYLKLKEKLNRDDILNILAEKANASALVKNARKVMGEDRFGDDEDVVNEVVDKMIAEKPVDNHKFVTNGNESIYWGKSIFRYYVKHCIYENLIYHKKIDYR